MVCYGIFWSGQFVGWPAVRAYHELMINSGYVKGETKNRD